MIFCVCGGVLEVGLIAAFLGWVSRVIFKRKAKKAQCQHTEAELPELPVAKALPHE